MSVLPTKEDRSPSFKTSKTRRLAIFVALTSAAAFSTVHHQKWENYAFLNGSGASDNSISLIQNFPPPKAEVLEYFDNNATSPERFAKIVLMLGATSPPSISQYLLGPLPTPISTLSLSAAALQLTPLRHTYTNPDVPYNGRLYAQNATYLQDFILQMLTPLRNATQDLLGGVVHGSRPASGEDVEEPDLLFGGSTPFSYDGSFRRTWIQLKENGPGAYLKARDMYFYIDMTSMKASEWYLIRMVYNRQVFATTAEFLEAYSNGTLKRSSPPDIPTADEEFWAGRARRGQKRDLDERAGPRQVSFNGPRYRVDKDNQWVSWMGWSFYLSFARDMGMSLWDVRFRGERISGSDPSQGSTVFLDGGFGMGTATRGLILGYDCPYDSLLLPAITHAAAGTILQQDAICAIKGYELLVRTISTVGNYDYLFDYTFQLDGTMEVRISASGYMQGAWWDDTKSPYGTKIRDTYMGSIHDHVINYKFDFDIAGTRNSLMAISLENEVVEQPWFDDDWGQEHQQKINYEGVYAIVNEEELNRWGYPRGYAIHPGVSPIHMTNLDSKRTKNNVNFGKAPPCRFSQEGLGTHFVFHVEHQLAGSTPNDSHKSRDPRRDVLLTPFNFNDWDPAMESMNAIVISVPEPGDSWTADENGVEIEYCLPPRVAKFNYPGTSTFEKDGTPGKPLRVHEMRQQAESYHAIFAASEL
ncbi:amine oxidase catalytic domain-containing protein [Mycena alexandri]|uniref:Amine oxidase n=1 Tax=Mycena alexandri TaxID=1745969 RepID=A0AAD6WKQ6_9AGAR|nr:amine oxidase catalytic domain-containing protein [Mycena alexandri]